MSSERWLAVLLVAAALAGCADVERGPRPPVPDAGPDAPASETGAGIPFASVRPLLEDGCRRCHMAGGMAGNSTFLLTGEATADYAAARAIVDPAAPTASRLLAKASGMGHGGGVIYRPGSAEYGSLLAWIAGGASP